MKSKLYTLTKGNFTLPYCIDGQNRVISSKADNIPMIKWPDGRWCTLANMYMCRLYEQGHSRNNDGGTLKTYAANISHLIRYCFKNKIDNIQFSHNLSQ